MRLLSVALFAFASLFASSLAGPDAEKWYAFYSGSEKDGLTFLDSDGGDIIAETSHAKLDEVKGDTGDKGLRFQYEDTTRFVTNQAHPSALVGVEDLDDSKNFKASIGANKTNYAKLVRAKFYGLGDGKWEVSLCLKREGDESNKHKDCIGANGHRDDVEYKWKVMQIPKAD